MLKILSNGCMVESDEPMMPRRLWIDGNMVYELNHRCGNRFCFNRNHMTAIVLEEHGMTIDHTANEYAPRKRLSAEAEQQILEMLKTHSGAEVARKFGINEMRVSSIKKRNNKDTIE